MAITWRDIGILSDAADLDDYEERDNLADRLEIIAVELGHYAYGNNEIGYRYPEWEEIATAFGALERVIRRLRRAERQE